MRTVGTLLKQARQEKGVSLRFVVQETKIKEKFLEALEEADWRALPNFSIAQGFVRSYARVAGVDSELALALLRRDFPKNISSRPQTRGLMLSARPVWTPRATAAAVAILTLGAVVYYLARQYMLFVAPPPLEVSAKALPEEILVSGKTAPSATIQVDRRLVLIEKDGTFRTTFDKNEVGQTIVVTAVSRSGKETTKVTPVTQ